jgi:hypothetical protein
LIDRSKGDIYIPITKLRRYGTVKWNSLGIASKSGSIGCNEVFANDVAGKETTGHLAKSGKENLRKMLFLNLIWNWKTTCLDLQVGELNQSVDYELPLTVPSIHQKNLQEDILVCLVMCHAHVLYISLWFVVTLHEFILGSIKNLNTHTPTTNTFHSHNIVNFHC